MAVLVGFMVAQYPSRRFWKKGDVGNPFLYIPHWPKVYGHRIWPLWFVFAWLAYVAREFVLFCLSVMLMIAAVIVAILVLSTVIAFVGIVVQGAAEEVGRGSVWLWKKVFRRRKAEHGELSEPNGTVH